MVHRVTVNPRARRRSEPSGGTRIGDSSRSPAPEAPALLAAARTSPLPASLARSLPYALLSRRLSIWSPLDGRDEGRREGLGGVGGVGARNGTAGVWGCWGGGGVGAGWSGALDTTINCSARGGGLGRENMVGCAVLMVQSSPIGHHHGREGTGRGGLVKLCGWEVRTRVVLGRRRGGAGCFWPSGCRHYCVLRGDSGSPGARRVTAGRDRPRRDSEVEGAAGRRR